MNRREEFWIKCWRDAAERSLYREAFLEERKCWDASADYYDTGMGSSNERVDVLLEYLKCQGFWEGTQKRVLDIGSGTGSFALPLAECGAAVTALDCSAEMNRIVCQKAQEKGVDVKVQTGDFNRLPFETQAYDLVIGSMNPGLYHPEPFLKMLSLSRDLVVYVGICDTPVKQKSEKCHKSLDEILLGHTLTHGGSNQVKYPYQLLKAMDYEPIVLPVQCQWRCAEEENQAVERLVRHYETVETGITVKKWREAIRNYVKDNLEEGHFINEGKTVMGVLVCSLKLEETALEMTV